MKFGVHVATCAAGTLLAIYLCGAILLYIDAYMLGSVVQQNLPGFAQKLVMTLYFDFLKFITTHLPNP